MATSKECLAQLSQMQNAQLNAVLVALTTSLINEARERNDAAEEPDVYRNQGAIKELKALRKHFKPKAVGYEFDEAYDS